MKAEQKIVSVEMPVSWGRATVIAMFEDGSEERLFGFYIDELSFSARELIGLTATEACALRMKRDIAYLQS